MPNLKTEIKQFSSFSEYDLRKMAEQMAGFKNMEKRAPMDESSNYDLYERFQTKLTETWELIQSLKNCDTYYSFETQKEMVAFEIDLVKRMFHYWSKDFYFNKNKYSTNKNPQC